MTKELCVTHDSIVVQSGSLALVYGRSPCVFERELRPHKMEILCVFCAQVNPGAPPLLGIGGCTFWQQRNCFVGVYIEAATFLNVDGALYG